LAKQIKEIDNLQQLKHSIREKKPENLYIFHGDETFLLHHYLNELHKLLVDDLTESFNYHRLNNENFEISALAAAVENLPMMAKYTMVQVDDIDFFKFSEDQRSKMIDILSDIPEYCTVVFTYETTPWKPDKRLKKLWDTVSDKGTIVEFSKQDPRELVPWITRHFAAKGKQISKDLCIYLIDITGGTMTALSGEIQKIAAYSGAEHIVRSDIDAVTEPVLDAVVFQMTDMLGQGQYASALTKLQQLLKMQQEPLSILGAVGLHFRRIGTARVLMDNGKTASDLMKMTGLSNYPAQKTMDSARRFQRSFCAKAAELILETDRKIKTSFDDPDRLLELLILQLAQEARRA
jgi:DNA polymerase-3 subunit delta